MDFQTHQEEAKQSTTKLIVLLVLGVIAIIAVVSVLMVGLLYYGSGELQPFSAIAVAAPVTTIGVVGASLVKSSQIRSGGGSYVALSMGGRPIDFNTQDLAEKQLGNVVEEMAIASGMPVPAVFVLDDEPGINAFAAGWTADNAALGVTRGALVHLNRRELQGVIAHEFSHIRNGDTRINTRIIGWVFGIAVITVLGRILLHSMWWAPRRRSKDNSAMVMMAAAIGLIVIGSVGSLFARMIQAAVSRQREYLADASAVQYTRDPSGIGDALMKIGGMGSGNKVRAAHATEASHLFFSSSRASSAFTAALATHPPLKERIRRLLPDWDGSFPTPDPALTAQIEPSPQPAPAGHDRWTGALPGQVTIPGMPRVGLPFEPGMMLAPGANQRYGQPTFTGPTDAHIAHARELLRQIPDEVQNYLHTRQGAVAAVIGALVSPDPELRRWQLDVAGQTIGMDPAYLSAASRVISDLDRRLQLPAIDIALHSVRETPYEYKLTLAQAVRAIEGSQANQDLFPWVLRRVMLRHLEDQHDDGSTRHDARLSQLGSQAATVYAVMAWFNSSGPSLAQESYEAALSILGLPASPVPPIESLTFDVIDEALDQLSCMNKLDRQTFVRGAATLVLHDERTTAEEAELVRVVADAVRLPVPPLLPV
jgi:Zn-dependent protease with chaperone function